MNRYEVDIEIAPKVKFQTDPARLRKIAELVLHQQRVEAPAGLTILLTDDETLQILNRDYREEDRPTDVLSFADGSTWPDGTLYLGDIAISLEMASRQAAAQGSDFQAELDLLTVHGILHLLGYDHADPEEKAVMWALQEEILTGVHNR